MQRVDRGAAAFHFIVRERGVAEGEAQAVECGACGRGEAAVLQSCCTVALD